MKEDKYHQYYEEEVRHELIRRGQRWAVEDRHVLVIGFESIGVVFILFCFVV
jgi:hypothetical protein